MRFFLPLALALSLSSCATLYKGYFSQVEILNAPDSLRVHTAEGVEIPVQYWIDRKRKYTPRGEMYFDQIDSTRRFIELRSSKDHVLVLGNGKNERRYAAYAKMSAGWAIIDFLCAGVPFIVDSITGNWNYFEPIDYRGK